MSAEVLVRVEQRLGRISLNRPAALHALTAGMCQTMTDALSRWRRDAGVRAVIIDHAPGTRGFCAGGDVRFVAEDARHGGGAQARRFFLVEYRLNDLMRRYDKPIIALMDGVTMGGGVGISVHGHFRVATERTLFAMPETGIGLFPDVGGGWFLPRLPGELGIWLGLTGVRLRGADCLAAGIATHYVESGALPALIERLEAADGEAALAAALAPHAEAPAPSDVLSSENRVRVARAFAFDTVEQIIAALEEMDDAWGREQLAVLREKSPQALKVSLRQMREGARAPTFAEAMKLEYRLASRVIFTHDFQEGVRATLVDKDGAPRWAPAQLAGVTPALLESIFAPLPPDEEWSPLS